MNHELSHEWQLGVATTEYKYDRVETSTIGLIATREEVMFNDEDNEKYMQSFITKIVQPRVGVDHFVIIYEQEDKLLPYLIRTCKSYNIKANLLDMGIPYIDEVVDEIVKTLIEENMIGGQNDYI